ncbi:peptidylprolyl isomerase [Micractinium conductrix]|uniref:Peptidylprolyl isomerase n=1 Tax=Micractinium conductrix TaxID=554055 RepID=A0A2P6VB45_9CHLO|nr:peptidylprolyl isomerase [Micractinium conductrix]|eukprot:PSC71288.1 peptidylprolyl isomerase [Micractinium conductrix]
MPPITVRVAFGPASRPGAVAQELVVEAAPSDTVAELKARVAAAAGGKVTADDLKLEFGPNARNIGRQYFRDPTVNEGELRLEQYSLLAWIERFPHWVVTARLLPPTPPPPGVAIQRAAAQAEQKNPDDVVADARSTGQIPKISDLPAPWGPKPQPEQDERELMAAGYLPARYPPESSPLNDVTVA